MKGNNISLLNTLDGNIAVNTNNTNVVAKEIKSNG